MGNFQRGGDRGGFKGGDRGGKPSFGGKKSWDRGGDRGDRGEVTMHKATCSDCGKTCEVPFRPTGEKPVFCSDCFSGKRGGDSRDGGRDSGRDFSRPAPRSDYKPAQSYSAPANDDSKRLLGEIAAKLDRLFVAVERMTEMKTREMVVEAPAVKSAPIIVPKAIAKKSASKEVVKKAVKAEAPVKTVAKKVATKKVATKKAK